ncbi:phosphatidylinositol N-acetylglucosaminyltransferase subunit C [Agrilus planipennis]|uniref:Phosphatidylinositol N-acetylglucosaminyltransferase subunit C n=1 Tax=Agrilus planipennis TaxID=224129 RepID=A0A1W4WKI7_AGRPL|nr:phosphatidylinositol N-acetylglucosaminyltransferase subunit C [Agrilus planipennis]
MSVPIEPDQQPWCRKLYANEGYPDNYTDETFLRELRKNIYFKPVSFKEAIKGASLVINELCTVVLFVLHYTFLYNNWIDPSTVFTYSSSVTFIGYIIYSFKSISINKKTIGHDVRTLLMYIVFGHLFSPVLHTLTDTISTDTIYTMTFFMMLIHLIFFNYGIDGSIVSNGLSISAAIFASICLSSRLASAFEAFVLMTFSTQCFILFPFLKAKVDNLYFITPSLVAFDIVVLWCVSKTMFALFLCSLVLLNGLCPYLFVKYQRHKDNIHGPWDEAVVEDTKQI